VLDAATATVSVEQRFTHVQPEFSVRFASQQPHYADCDSKAINEACLKIGKAVQYGDDKDVDAADLCSVLQFTARRTGKRASLHDFGHYLLTYLLHGAESFLRS